MMFFGVKVFSYQWMAAQLSSFELLLSCRKRLEDDVLWYYHQGVIVIIYRTMRMSFLEHAAADLMMNQKFRRTEKCVHEEIVSNL